LVFHGKRKREKEKMKLLSVAVEAGGWRICKYQLSAH